jgi:hypothetical protein
MKFFKDLYYKNWESNRKDNLKQYEDLADFNLSLINDEFSFSELPTSSVAAPKFNFGGSRGVTLKTIEENEEVVVNSIFVSFSIVFAYNSQPYELRCSCEVYDSNTDKGAYLDLYGRDSYPENHPAFEKLNVICFWVSNRLLVALKQKFGKNGDVFKLLGKENYIELVGYLKFIEEHQTVGI